MAPNEELQAIYILPLFTLTILLDNLLQDILLVNMKLVIVESFLQLAEPLEIEDL